ncbi:hypothetical protein [Propionivibrio sp.]|uniref:hypothetical protein n=1 Tax=Propionivibrio sp. TaxID=2212460 RepID=UPI0025D4D435|nr:hypothetical protein [Propionivibrio sp.]MBK7357504.1 hypothetical protein [Propionivibrio sp.]
MALLATAFHAKSLQCTPGNAKLRSGIDDNFYRHSAERAICATIKDGSGIIRFLLAGRHFDAPTAPARRNHHSARERATQWRERPARRTSAASKDPNAGFPAMTL